jgi:putative peptide zinc metalloprotease protein
MAEPAKLELLARSIDAAGFQVVEIDSHHAYWAYKPRRLPPTEWELTPQPKGVDGNRHFALKNLRRDSYLLLNASEYFFWEYFDGRHSLEEIARAYHLASGSFDYALIRRLLAKLYNCGLLDGQSISALRSNQQPPGKNLRWTSRFGWKVKKWRAASFRIPNADRVCSLLYDRGGFLLFHPFSLWLSLAVAAAALALAAARPGHNASDFALFIKTRPVLIGSVMLATLLGASMLHVLVHALACKAHGRRVRELGFFLLQGIVPTFYADVTDIFMSTRRARIAVDLAGPMVEVVLGSVAMISAHAASPGIGQALLFGIGLTLWEGALINLYPFNFLEMDGYNILADLLAMPMLRQQALTLIPSLTERTRHLRKLGRAEWLQVGYLALCLISVALYLIVHIDGLRALIQPS